MRALEIESAVVQLAWMLLGAAILGMLAWRIRLPYPVALVVGAILVEESHLVVVPRLEPGILLFVLLPPLLFDAAFRLDDKELRSVARPVLALAVPGTLATAAIVGLVLIGLLRLPWQVALLFGSIVAATDPVAVVAVFRALRAPGRLSVIAEGESLLNDGIAITLYTVLVGLVTAGEVDALGGIGLFARQLVGGVLIGALLGVVFSRLTAAIDDHLIEMTLSTALAYGSYLIAQSVETSGALACVAAGLIHGSYGRQVACRSAPRDCSMTCGSTSASSPTPSCSCWWGSARAWPAWWRLAGLLALPSWPSWQRGCWSCSGCRRWCPADWSRSPALNAPSWYGEGCAEL